MGAANRLCRTLTESCTRSADGPLYPMPAPMPVTEAEEFLAKRDDVAWLPQ